MSEASNPNPGNKMKLMTKTSLVFALLLTGVALGQAQETWQRNVEPQGGFSLCVPEGWSIEAQKDDKFKMLFAPHNDTFTANINFKKADSALSAASFLMASIKDVFVSVPANYGTGGIKLVGWTDFTAAAGRTGSKLVFEVEYKGFLIRSVQYYFEGEGTDRFIITGTCLMKDADSFDHLFDRAAKSFQLESPPAK